MFSERFASSPPRAYREMRERERETVRIAVGRDKTIRPKVDQRRKMMRNRKKRGGRGHRAEDESYIYIAGERIQITEE